MHPTGPYQREFTWHLRASMTECDMKPMDGEYVQELVRPVVELQD